MKVMHKVWFTVYGRKILKETLAGCLVVEGVPLLPIEFISVSAVFWNFLQCTNCVP